MIKYKLECISAAFIIVSIFNSAVTLLSLMLGRGNIKENHTAMESTSPGTAFNAAFGCDIPIPPPSSGSKILPDVNFTKLSTCQSTLRDKIETLIKSNHRELGPRFQTAVYDLLGQDAMAHYWGAAILSEPENINTFDDLDFPIKLLDDAIARCNSVADLGNNANALSMSVLAAALCQAAGRTQMAITHKLAAEKLVQEHPILLGAFPYLGHYNNYYEQIVVPP